MFHILVNFFDYKPSIALSQFFQYGFSEPKMAMCCDIIEKVKEKNREIKVQRSLSRKRVQT